MDNQQYPNDEVNLRDYIEVMLKRKKTILIVFLLCLIITTVFSFLMPKVYEAAAIIEIGNIPKPINPSIHLTPKDEAIQRFKTDKMLEPIIQILSLNINEVPLGRMIKIENIKNTNFLKLRVKYPDPQLAIKICNTTADYFVQQGNKTYERKLLLMKGEIDKLERRSKIIEEEIEKLNKVNLSQVSSSDFLILQNVLSNYETTYLDLSERIYSLKQTLMDSTKFEVFKPAVTIQSIKPNKQLNIIISAVLGLIAGIFIAFLQEFWQKSKN